MKPLDAFVHGWQRCLDFSGSSKRPEFWWFIIINALCYAILSFISNQLSIFYSFVSILPIVAVGLRRLRDSGKSGWWYLVNLIPFFGNLIFLVFCAQPSKD